MSPIKGLQIIKILFYSFFPYYFSIAKILPISHNTLTQITEIPTNTAEPSNPSTFFHHTSSFVHVTESVPWHLAASFSVISGGEKGMFLNFMFITNL
jgi:hypothetical protein